MSTRKVFHVSSLSRSTHGRKSRPRYGGGDRRGAASFCRLADPRDPRAGALEREQQAQLSARGRAAWDANLAVQAHAPASGAGT
jgi:hypothetical protein